eukprot:TRINITY_DN51925_c0_g1_i1.p2 TRINITY_DN51925_c0_g1~~TRINITY_DN51925_c0_g1_i1.p2  ORF type:complete len:225 (-),score=55.60 TRINITY_DN51925_c0_g1_i1:317-991(-)
MFALPSAMPNAETIKVEKGAAKKRKGDHSDKAEAIKMNKLIALIAKLTLSNTQQLRMINSIVLDVFLIPTESPTAQQMKAGTTLYAASVKEIDIPQRVPRFGLPHHHAWNNMLASAFELANETEKKEYVTYKGRMDGSSADLYSILTNEVKVCKIMKSFDANRRKLYVNVVTETPSYKIWLVTKGIFKRTQGFQEKPGQAPPGALENTIQEALEQMGESTQANQ